MRIIERQEFLRLPANTIYCKYRPYILGDIHVKGRTIHGDFYTTDISTHIEHGDTGFRYKLALDAVEGGCNARMTFDKPYRDGLFDDWQLFAVWDNQDISGLIETLIGCLV